jgi:hypothetical protein
VLGAKRSSRFFNREESLRKQVWFGGLCDARGQQARVADLVREKQNKAHGKPLRLLLRQLFVSRDDGGIEGIGVLNIGSRRMTLFHEAHRGGEGSLRACRRRCSDHTGAIEVGPDHREIPRLQARHTAKASLAVNQIAVLGSLTEVDYSHLKRKPIAARLESSPRFGAYRPRLPVPTVLTVSESQVVVFPGAANRLTPATYPQQATLCCRGFGCQGVSWMTAKPRHQDTLRASTVLAPRALFRTYPALPVSGTCQCAS